MSDRMIPWTPDNIWDARLWDARYHRQEGAATRAEFLLALGWYFENAGEAIAAIAEAACWLIAVDVPPSDRDNAEAWHAAGHYHYEAKVAVKKARDAVNQIHDDQPGLPSSQLVDELERRLVVLIDLANA